MANSSECINVEEVCWAVAVVCQYGMFRIVEINSHQALGDDRETEQVDDFLVTWSNSLCEGGSQSPGWEVLDGVGSKRVEAEWKASKTGNLLAWVSVVPSTLGSSVDSGSAEGTTESVSAVYCVSKA